MQCGWVMQMDFGRVMKKVFTVTKTKIAVVVFAC